MARKPTSREEIERLLAKYEPVFRVAFLSAIDDIKSNAQVTRIAVMLERGDIAGAIEAIHLQPAAFRILDNAIIQAYNDGGAATVGTMPVLRDPNGSRLVIRFDARNFRAEQWLREHSSELITRIVEDQRLGVQTALTTGMEAGRNPRSVALEVVGRINRATGKREGGIIGLTSIQERYVASAREELLSNDQSLLRHYLERGRRDKRFDRTILKAIKEGKPIPAEVRERIIQRYSDGLLKLRGDTIARTEAMASLHASQDEAFRQAVDTGRVQASQVRRVWRSAEDGRVRYSHRTMSGTSVGLDEPFISPRGALLRYPGDPKAQANEIVNCRCHLDMRIDFLANIE